MKRFLAIILAGLMLLTLVACGEKKDDNVDRRGALHAENSMKFTSSAHQEHKEKANESNRETIYYNNLSAAILDLESGKIGSIFAEVCATVGELADVNAECRNCPYFKYFAGGCRAVALTLTGNKMGVDLSKCLFFKRGYYEKVVHTMGEWKNNTPIEV